VAADFHGLVAWSSHLPKPTVRSAGRTTPMAWKGPVIQRSMWLRAALPNALDTATLPLLPAWSPSAV
jgi:hypothetical protein